MTVASAATIRVAAVASVVMLAACGATTTENRPAPWAAAHPDPTGMHFADAQGICSVTVRYPNDAPGEIDYQGRTYIQRSRSSTTGVAGRVVGRSADWTVHLAAQDTLVLVSGGTAYTYKSGANCGSNSSPPS
jgi:hypothetical protein